MLLQPSAASDRKRKYMLQLENVKREAVAQGGIFGTLFSPASKPPFPAPLIITLGGGAGGLNEFRAQLLASYGFISLSLAYFGCEGLPPDLANIPLEYFEKAIAWLQNHPAIDPCQIALWGISRGAELSLIIGSLFPQKISAIAAYVPSSVVYEALIYPDQPAWTYRGKPLLPGAPFPLTSDDLPLNRDKPLALTPFFLQGMENKELFNASAIPVENLQCPLLLISGEEDQMWPSTLFAHQIQLRLQKKGSSISCSHYSYPGAGHFLTPFGSHITSGRVHSLDSLCFDFGGHPEANAKASLDAWEKTLRFFELYLKSPPKRLQ
jgi:dienelactone hydrolase